MSIESVVDKLSSLIGAIGALIAAVISWKNLKKIAEVHVQINSRMDQLLRTTGLLGEAEGQARERKERGEANR